jgi:aryl-alcohol dehydrogenase-like predicted oxidoreductase
VRGQVPPAEVRQILDAASAGGIDTIDTAAAYGESEQVLGMVGVARWQVVTKLPPLPEQVLDVSGWALEIVQRSLARLRVPRLHGLLLHRSRDLLGPRGRKLYATLQRLQNAQMVRGIGVSIYDPDELDSVFPVYSLQLVQAPFNVLDRRIVQSGWLTRLLAAGIEVHTRSAFLQGLLLLGAHERPAKFSRWAGVWRQWDDFTLGSRERRLSAALGFVLSTPGISRVIVGIDCLRQLQEITAAAENADREAPDLRCDDLQLLNPARWTELGSGPTDPA